MSRSSSGPWDARWLSRIGALSLELVGYRYRRSRAALAIAIAEPILLVIFFTVMQNLVGVNRPPFGTSAPLFYLTGILPLYLFFHTSLRFRNWDNHQRFPRVSEFDLACAQLVAELAAKIVILAVCTLGLHLAGVVDAIPDRPLLCLAALVILALFGAGFGIVNAVIAGFFFPWNYLYQIAIRGWMVFSGVLFVVDYMPPTIRNAAAWIPVTHGVILYRTGQYIAYPNFVLDVQYLLVTTVGMLAFGWLVEGGTRRWRSFR